MKVVKILGLEKKWKRTFKTPHKGLIVALAFASHIIRVRINHRTKAIPNSRIQSLEGIYSRCRNSFSGMLINLKNLELQIVKESVSFSNFRVFRECSIAIICCFRCSGVCPWCTRKHWNLTGGRAKIKTQYGIPGWVYDLHKVTKKRVRAKTDLANWSLICRG